MRASNAKKRDTDVVVCVREHEVIRRREELRIGQDTEREDFYTLQTWGENYENKLVPMSRVFSVNRATLMKLRAAIDGILSGENDRTTENATE